MQRAQDPALLVHLLVASFASAPWTTASAAPDLKTPRPAQPGEGAAKPRGQGQGVQDPNCPQGGEVAERGEAGEGLSRFMLKDPGHRPGGGTGRGPQLAFSHDLIRAKQQVPDDPLAGLPNDDGNRGGRGKGSARGNSRAACAVMVSAANERDIGDLRAALALLKHGPNSLPCPSRAAESAIRMRISIDGDGKITAAEPAAGDRSVASTVAKRLAGKSIGPWAAGATVGIVVMTFTSGKP